MYRSAFLVFLTISISLCSKVPVKCPYYCKCEFLEEHSHAICSSKDLQNPNLELPETVQLLDLSYNNITVIDNTCFKNYSFLSYLDVSHNALHTISTNAFSMLRHVRIIDLSFNQLTDLDEDLFETNRYLYGVNLEGNKFMLQRKRRIIRSNFLRSLNLRNSQLYFIEELMFAGLPQLHELDLSENLLIQINMAAFAVLPNLRLLDITANYWMSQDLILLKDVERLREQNPNFSLRYWNIDQPKNILLDEKYDKFEKVISTERNEIEEALLNPPFDLKSLADNNEYNHEDDSNKNFLKQYFSNVPHRCRGICGVGFFELRESCDHKLSKLRNFITYKQKHYKDIGNDDLKYDLKYFGFAFGCVFGILITICFIYEYKQLKNVPLNIGFIIDNIISISTKNKYNTIPL